MYRSGIKRFLGFFIALIALICFFPVLVIVTLVLFFINRGSGAFFLQERPGINGKIFKIIKFKTMTDERDEKGELLPDIERLTPVGRFIRSTSIDELPQLINVLKGDMALIGPRPLLTWFVPLYDNRQRHRMDVRPGITGWAQVNGRNALTYSQKFEYDVWYVEHLSFGLDARIFWMSILKVLRHSDIGEGDGDDETVDDLHFRERYIASKSYDKNN